MCAHASGCAHGHECLNVCLLCADREDREKLPKVDSPPAGLRGPNSGRQACVASSCGHRIISLSLLFFVPFIFLSVCLSACLAICLPVMSLCVCLSCVCVCVCVCVCDRQTDRQTDRQSSCEYLGICVPCAYFKVRGQSGCQSLLSTLFTAGPHTVSYCVHQAARFVGFWGTPQPLPPISL